MQIALPDGCQRLEMEDGTKYNRHKQTGYTTVNNSEHLKAIAQSYLGKPMHHVSGHGYDCDRCGHGCWEWQTRCPHCGKERV